MNSEEVLQIFKRVKLNYTYNDLFKWLSTHQVTKTYIFPMILSMVGSLKVRRVCHEWRRAMDERTDLSWVAKEKTLRLDPSIVQPGQFLVAERFLAVIFTLDNVCSFIAFWLKQLPKMSVSYGAMMTEIPGNIVQKSGVDPDAVAKYLLESEFNITGAAHNITIILIHDAFVSFWRKKSDVRKYIGKLIIWILYKHGCQLDDSNVYYDMMTFMIRNVKRSKYYTLLDWIENCRKRNAERLLEAGLSHLRDADIETFRALETQLTK